MQSCSGCILSTPPIARKRVIGGIFIAIMKILKMFHDSKVINMPKEYADVLIERITTLCKNRDITLNKLAEMSGVSQSTLDNLVNGKTFNPRVKTLHKVALAFGMTLAEFLDYPELNEFSFDE